MNKKQDLTDQRFGMLTALSEVKERRQGKVMWLCKCDCGKLHIAPKTRLVNDKVHSCGCLRYIRASKSLTKHGKRHSRLYSIWANMKNRCHLESSTEYKRYGARGIHVCPEWRDNFQTFYNWAMENGYQDNLTLERIENNGNYEPANCRWATTKEQNRNTRRTRYLTYGGKTQCIADWADETGLSQSLIRQRIEKLHWSIEKTLTTPVKKVGEKNA